MKLAHHLSQLENAELVLRLEEEELAFIFKHALLQNTAYDSLLRHDRKRLHLQVAKALERIYSEQLPDFAALLARHFALAGESDKAIAYARLAAEGEVARYAYEEAVQNLETALGLIDPGQASEVHLTLLEKTGDVYRLLRNAERALSMYRQALDLRGTLNGVDKMTPVRLHRKIVQTVIDAKWAVNMEFMERANQIRQASRASLESELKLRESAPPHTETVEALTALSIDAWRIQSPPDWDAAQRFAASAVEIAEQLPNPAVLSRALDALASVYDGRSQLREHLQIALRRLSITQDPSFDDLREKIDALRGAGMAQMYVGEYTQALPYLADAENLADRIQAIELQTFALGLQSQCWFRLDRWDKVLEIEEKWRGLEQRYSRERTGPTCFYVALSASVYAWRGNTRKAKVYRDETVNYMVSASGPFEEWQRNQRY